MSSLNKFWTIVSLTIVGVVLFTPAAFAIDEVVAASIEGGSRKYLGFSVGFGLAFAAAFASWISSCVLLLIKIGLPRHLTVIVLPGAIFVTSTSIAASAKTSADALILATNFIAN